MGYWVIRERGAMMNSYKILSSDSHVVEPPDLWTKRIDGEFVDRAPRLVEEEDGDWWYIEGEKYDSIGENNSAYFKKV